MKKELPYNTDEIKEGSICPYCNIGTIRKRTSKFGEFYGCDEFPRCAFKINKREVLDVGQAGYRE